MQKIAGDVEAIEKICDVLLCIKIASATADEEPTHSSLIVSNEK
jgi:hypothetical protein